MTVTTATNTVPTNSDVLTAVPFILDAMVPRRLYNTVSPDNVARELCRFLLLVNTYIDSVAVDPRNVLQHYRQWNEVPNAAVAQEVIDVVTYLLKVALVQVDRA